MADVAQLLQSLHPMREPPPPSPVMPFLAMLALGVGIAAIGFVVWQLARKRRAGLQRSAELALADTRGLEPAERMVAQAWLLRRVVRARVGERAARAQGERWLVALDSAFTTTFFTAGAGRAYADGLYRRGDGSRSTEQVEALDRALVGLIPRIGKRPVAEADA